MGFWTAVILLAFLFIRQHIDTTLRISKIPSDLGTL